MLQSRPCEWLLGMQPHTVRLRVPPHKGRAADEGLLTVGRLVKRGLELNQRPRAQEPRAAGACAARRRQRGRHAAAYAPPRLRRHGLWKLCSQTVDASCTGWLSRLDEVCGVARPVHASGSLAHAWPHAWACTSLLEGRASPGLATSCVVARSAGAALVPIGHASEARATGWSLRVGKCDAACTLHCFSGTRASARRCLCRHVMPRLHPWGW